MKRIAISAGDGLHYAAIDHDFHPVEKKDDKEQ
jgi:hypothetical protein